MIAPGPSTRPASRLAPLLASALCLSACASAPPGTAVGSYPAASAGADGQRALASLPAAAGRVVAVRRVPYANGFGQEIVLDGPRAMSGENLVTVQALTTAATGLRGQGAEELKLGRPTDTEIAAEMDRALPGIAMRMASTPERGEAGAIGYATGGTGRLSCVYAWQYLEPARPLSLLEGAAGAGALPVSVRVRLCREQPAAALVEALRGLRVSRPDGSPAPAAPRASAGGDALTDAVGSLPPAAARNAEAAEPAAPAEAVRPARRRGHRLAAARPRGPAHPRASLRRASAPRTAALQGMARQGTARREPSAELAGVPRVPLPGEVWAGAAHPGPAAPRPAPASAPRDAAADLGMPMPR